MLWYKSWLETRSRFLCGLVLLMIVAAGTVFSYPQVLKLLTAARTIDTSGEMGRLIRESVELSREFRGHVWWQWYRQNLVQMGTLFAALLGSGGLLSQTSGGTLFTLSMPVSRSLVLGIRAATGLAEFLILAVVPSLLIPLLAPAIGQSYSAGDALVHGACLFIAGAVFFSLAFLLSTVFDDLWRPWLMACLVAGIVSLLGLVVPGFSRYGPFGVMSGDLYFRGGGLPWLGLIASAAASAAMLYGSVINIARRDF